MESIVKIKLDVKIRTKLLAHAMHSRILKFGLCHIDAYTAITDERTRLMMRGEINARSMRSTSKL